VLTEAATIGIVGALGGVALGLIGAGVIDLAAPQLFANVDSAFSSGIVAGAGQRVVGAQLKHVVPVLLHASVGFGSVAVAAMLSVLGGLLAGAFGCWRAARLQPAAALRRIE
jgi:ABC-type antimicrobial peptide transport system permease subunit